MNGLSSLLLPVSLLAALLAPTDELDELIRKGRKLLDAGEPAKAQVIFEQADAETRGELRTRMWVLRAWMDQGRINDSFNHLEKNFTTRGVEGPDVDYLFGMASYRRAQAMINSGGGGSAVTFAFADAMSYLRSATAADPKKYHDAFVPLADAAWQSQKNDVAAGAAEQAVALAPEDASAVFLLGQIRLSQFVVAQGEEGAEAGELLGRAIEAYRRAAGLVRDPHKDTATVALIHKKLGDAHMWRAQRSEEAEEKQAALAEAGAAYADAAAWDPTVVDYVTLWGQLVDGESRAPFVRCLAAAAEKFREHHGERTNMDATLLWWLGYGQFATQDYEAAEASFRKSVAKWPAYANSWFYVGMARYHRQDWDGMVEALRRNWEADPASLVGAIQADRKYHLEVLDYVLGQLAKRANEGRKWAANVDAAFLCQVRTGAFPENWVYWDNLGLFSRDAGQYLRATRDEENAAEAQRLFEQALAAYVKAIELAPDKPHLKNDAGVILDYYLEREYDRALALYEAAQAQASELLAAGGLEDFELELAQTAQRDSKENIAKLREKLEKKKKKGDDGDDGPR